MPGIVALIDAISDNVVSSLAAASYPALTDGEILIGRQYQFEGSAPPRIVFVPTKSVFPDKDVYNRSPTGGAGPYTAEQLAQNQNRSIRSENITFEVRCWGASPTNDPGLDFDYTQALYQQVIRSIDHLALGSYIIGAGDWTDAKFTSGQLIRDGREMVFSVTFMTPILERLEALPLAPNNVVAENTDKLELPTGQIETGCQGN